MRKIKFILVAASFAILLNSCVFSLFPIYTVDTLVYDEALLGRYESENTIITISQDSLTSMKSIKSKKFNGTVEMTETSSDGDSKEEISELKKLAGYSFSIQSDDEIYRYNAHLVKIADDLYLDLFPEIVNGSLGAKKVDPFVDNLYPIHTFMKVEFNDQELKLINFNLEKLNELFKKNLIRLRHEIVYDIITSSEEDGDVVITAKPEEIQKFIASYSKQESVFDSPDIYKRQ